MAAQSESLLEACWLHCRERGRVSERGREWGRLQRCPGKGEGRRRDRGGVEERRSAVLVPTAASARQCDRGGGGKGKRASLRSLDAAAQGREREKG